MMGRPPKPTPIKVLEGNPGKRRLNQDEPRLAIGRPRCPDYLDETAQREWKRVVRILMRMRVLTEADQTMLGIWCQTFSTMVDAQEKLKQAGTLYKTKGGFVQASPLFGIVTKCVNTMAKIASEFGLTPSARVRLHSAPETKAANKWSEVG
jgi:P27 family predicted phage terminase small subunit